MAKLPHLILACEGTPANALRGLRPGECRAFLCQRIDTCVAVFMNTLEQVCSCSSFSISHSMSEHNFLAQIIRCAFSVKRFRKRAPIPRKSLWQSH